MSNLNSIDDYLAGRMNDAEKDAFENQLASDSELNQEYMFQKDVVNSIQQARKAELKSMLNEIPVSGGGSSSSMFGKVAASVLIAGAVAGGIYLLSQNDTADNDPVAEEPALIQEDINEPGEFIPEETKSAEEASNASEEILDENIVPEEKESLVQEENIVEDEASEPRVQKPAEINTPNLLNDFETEKEKETSIAEPDVYTETEDYSVEKLSTSNIEVITDNTKRKYRFHYQFVDDKLYLYGDFSESLYEILEFNTSKGNTVYLYYKNKYYLIDQNQKEIASLESLEDDDLVKKLDKLRD